MRVPRPFSFAASSLLLRAGRPLCTGWESSWSSLRPGGFRRLTKNDGIKSFGLHGRFLSSAVQSLMEHEKDQLYDDGKAAEKEAALQSALTQLAGDFDKESMLSLRRFFVSHYTPVISTGSLKLDLALGIGGLPKGRIIEIFGKEASGKTTLALHVVKEAQKHGGYCAYFDLENSLDPSLAESIGVDLEGLLFARPSSAENSLSVINTLANSGSIDVIVVDSVAALVPELELKGVVDLAAQDMQSRLMTKALNKIYYSLVRSQTLLILVNQTKGSEWRNLWKAENHDMPESSVRSNLKKPISGHLGEVTCGGNAVKFYSAIRLRMSRAGLLQTEDEITGIGVSVQVIKNKLAPAMKKADLHVEFGRGIRHEAEILEIASQYGIVSREQNGYWIQGEYLRDKLEAEQYLAENDSLADELTRTLRSQLFRT
ncbi:hypothetical protein Taro_004731 [Colocasia esculenta]|uniref:Bacterial recombinase A n=1 Tax=Colocasia esculenta TaxID=4460 RepID=A0A843TN56_COLES|nr:hypothetical protein [Colocasia esculenta]